jgi:hypothetical protein
LRPELRFVEVFDLRPELLRFEELRDLRPELFFFAARLRAGTFAPFFRASDKPMAIACLRLFTLPPRPFLPLRSEPRLRRRIALSTLRLAPGLYLRLDDFFRDDFLRVAMSALSFSYCSVCPTSARLPS